MRRVGLGSLSSALWLARGVWARRASDRWEDGDAGYEWKRRHLDETRATATQFMSDVARRGPIHDGIRARARWNEDRLLRAPDDGKGASSVMGEAIALNDPTHEAQASASSRTGDMDGLWEALQAESNGDLLAALRYVPQSDINLLASEIYGSAAADAERRTDELLRSWFALRRSTGQLRSYASVPQEERNMWSAWYLRHEASRRK
jgi:hypothetical protein